MGLRARAGNDVDTTTRDWLSAVVTRVESAGQRLAPWHAKAGVSLRVAADGSILEVQIAAGRLKADAGRRIAAAVLGSDPLAPPPAELLMEDGSTSLSWLIGSTHSAAWCSGPEL